MTLLMSTGHEPSRIVDVPARMSDRTIRIVTESLRTVAPTALVVRVSVSEPESLWLARAYGQDGAEVQLPFGVDEALARWVACDQPGRDWRLQHDIDLSTGIVTAAGSIRALATTGR
ncbi:hypothetical protein ACFVH7_29525 [Kitasatospora indigofera]|uniref:hypothetical protein n=1 Tax=Kitasatospora indigofera TaxID=67307 RepID=UPI00363D858E